MGGQARNNWTNQAAILSAKSLHVQSQTGSGLDCLEKQRCAVFAEIANIKRPDVLSYLGQENIERQSVQSHTAGIIVVAMVL